MRRLAAWALFVCAGGTARAADAPICADRPGKANAVCTVPAGRVQVETAAVDWSLAQSRGAYVELLTMGASYVKLGVTDNSDLEFGFTPYGRLTTREEGSGSRVSGTGDVVLRYKQRITRPDARIQVTLIPFVKLPTAARGLGNGAVEGGVAVPVSFTLVGQVAMTFGPEVDALKDTHGNGHHPAFTSVVNVSAPVAQRLTLSGELWGNFNFEPRRTVKQLSANVALAYALSKDVQLDGGANLGLTSATPDVEGYVGLSLRF